MPPDSNVESNQVAGDVQTGGFGRASEDTSPTKQDSRDLGCLTKYDLLLVLNNNIAIRCIGCMEYIWEHEYTPDVENDAYINDFSFNFLVSKIIDHHLSCTYWNKNG